MVVNYSYIPCNPLFHSVFDEPPRKITCRFKSRTASSHASCKSVHAAVLLKRFFPPLTAVNSCPALPAPSYGARLGCPKNATMYYDTVCQFSCNDGYIGSGSQARRCQHNGTWSGQDFTCQGTYSSWISVITQKQLQINF